jgi:toxin ParE1/3/4
VKVHWTLNALQNLRNIRAYIAQDSSVYAQRMIDKLTSRSKQIGLFPLLGGMVREYQIDDIREVIEPPYRIIYRVLAHQVDILAVVHWAQLLPPTLP